MWLAFGYQIASRLAYVLWVGWVLTVQERDGRFAKRWGAERAFRRFRLPAGVLMLNDALSLVVLSVVSAHTLRLALPHEVLVGTGVVLMVVGLVTKAWATAALGHHAYFWYDFFVPVRTTFRKTGPYRVLKNPMYTLGYVQTYGVAIAFASWPGLVAAALDHIAIVVFYHRVEKPHFDRLTEHHARPYD